ncbi:MAG: phosphatase PAP2 family protein, partial [Coprococcus sp.]
MDTLYELDCNVLLWIQEHLRCDFLTPVMKCITILGNAGIIWIAITIIMIIIPKYRKAGVASAIALILNLLVINIVIKNMVARIRPYEVIPGLELLIEKQSDWSFPSGHTSASFATACSILLAGHRNIGIAALAFAVVMGFTRLYLGVHYPSDVLAGALLGFLFAVIADIVVKKIIAYKQSC